MKKRFLSFFLCLALLCGLFPTVQATETHENRLQEITKTVRTQLNIDTAFYTDFHGDLSGGLFKNTWQLNWSNKDGFSLDITADENGLIRYYDAGDPGYHSTYSSFFAPTFPTDSAGANTALDAFLKKVLPTGETARINTCYSSQDGTYWNYNGTVLVQGLPSPISFWARVEGSAVTYYRRSGDDRMQPGVPTAKAATAAADAAKLLMPLTEFELQYILGDDHHATLQYIPLGGDSYYVDAQTGELINLSELERELVSKGGLYAGGTSAAPEAADEDSAAADRNTTLTQAEKDGAALLRDVIPAEEALQALQEAYPALQLEQGTLVSHHYYVTDVQTGSVQLSLTVTRELEDGQLFRFYLYLDGKTGELLRFSSSRGERTAVNLTADEGKALAAAFLAQFDADAAKQCVVTECFDDMTSKYATNYSYIFTQKVNGYPFYANYFEIGVDSETGAVSYLYGDFDHEITFETPRAMISATNAKSAYYSAFETQLRYIQVPFALDPAVPELRPLCEAGVDYLYALTLAYVPVLENGSISGVDAESGQPIITHYDDSSASLTYTDIAQSDARAAIEALAAVNIGFSGGRFFPETELTQLDWLALLHSAGAGYPFDPAEESVDSLYQFAYYKGYLSYGERDEKKILTRAEMLKLLLDMAGYANTARLENIFTVSYPDSAEIPSEYLGYAAIASAIGLMQTDTAFAADKVATRADAATLLHDFMRCAR